MAEKKPEQTPPTCGEGCRVAAVLRVDERGQLVLPKDVRDRMGLTAGERLALTTVESNGKVCCLVLVKADALAEGVRMMMRIATEDECAALERQEDMNEQERRARR